MNLLRRLYEIKCALFRTSRPGLHDLDRKLAAYLDKDNGFFIEAGANDGYLQSNTYYLEKRRGWSGLLVEGIPELATKCIKNRPGSQVVHCALVGPEYPDETITMHYAHLTSIMEGAFPTPEQGQEHLRRGRATQRLDEGYEVEVPARTLESVLEEIPDLPVIDFFSLDVEGAELQVLHGMNLERFRPRFLLVEARFYEAVHAFLSAHDFEQIEKLTHHDVLYQDVRLSTEA